MTDIKKYLNIKRDCADVRGIYDMIVKAKHQSKKAFETFNNNFSNLIHDVCNTYSDRKKQMVDKYSMSFIEELKLIPDNAKTEDLCRDIHKDLCYLFTKNGNIDDEIIEKIKKLADLLERRGLLTLEIGEKVIKVIDIFIPITSLKDRKERQKKIKNIVAKNANHLFDSSVLFKAMLARFDPPKDVRSLEHITDAKELVQILNKAS